MEIGLACAVWAIAPSPPTMLGEADGFAVSSFIFDAECERIVADLLAMMTPLQKAGQLAMPKAPDPSDDDAMDQLCRDIRKGRIGSLRDVRNKEQADFLQQVAYDESPLGIPLLFAAEPGNGLETVFPSALAVNSSWDLEAIEAASAVIAQESGATGANWLFFSDLAFTCAHGFPKSYRCGEDLHLAARVAAAKVRGVQKQERRGEPSMLASLDLSECLAQGDQLDGRMLLGLALPSITQERVGGISWDRLGGEPRGKVEQTFAFVKGPGGFDGILLSEWADLARLASASGMAGRHTSVQVDELTASLENDSIPIAQVDDAVARILRAKVRSGLLSAAHAGPVGLRSGALPTPVHNREVALDLAKRCTILLRNDPALLPLCLDSGDILLVGKAAGERHAPLGDRGGIAASVLDGFEQLGVPHRFVSGLALRDNGTHPGKMIPADRMAIGMASEAAKRAGTVIVVLNQPDHGEIGEAQETLLSALYAANANLILVTIGAVPIDPDVNRRPLPSLLHAGRLGTMSGHAIAEVLTGECSPSGKLPYSLERPDGSQGLPFGHGLTYADFALTAFACEVGPEGIYASANLLNASRREGCETVQLYLARRSHAADPAESPVLRLVDFRQVRLRPRDRESVVFEIGREQLGEHFDDGSFRLVEGTYDVFIGLSSTRGLTGSFELTHDIIRTLTGQGVHPGDGKRRASF